MNIYLLENNLRRDECFHKVFQVKKELSVLFKEVTSHADSYLMLFKCSLFHQMK